MADSARPAFRPMRGRASLGALPSLSGASANNKENPSTARDSTTPAAFGEGTSTHTTAQSRKKRAQSLGGDALESARKRLRNVEALRREATLTLELSPSKIERRRAVPRRSILKQTPARSEDANHTISFPPSASSMSARLAAWEETHAQTTDLSALSAFSTTPQSGVTSQPQHQRRRSSLKPRASVASGTYDDSDLSASDMDEVDDTNRFDDPNGSLDMDVTRFENATALYDFQGRRKSVAHSRRVSFAPSAAIRTFTPDKPTAEAQAYEAARRQAEAEAAEAAAIAGETSLTHLSGDEDEASVDQEDEDDTGNFGSEPSMEIAGDEVTLAFRGHFAGTQIPLSALHDAAAEDEDEDESLERSMEDEDGTKPMDEVTGGITSAFAAHFEQKAPTQQEGEGGFDASAVHARAQAEAPGPSATTFTLFNSSANAASQAVLPTLAGAATRKGPRPSEVARQEDEDDEAVMRELGFARGGRPRKSRIGFAIAEEAEDQDEDDDENDSEGDMDMEDATGAMDMTTVVGGIVQVAPQTDPTAAAAVEQEDDDDEGMDSDAEVSMQLTAGDRTVDMTFATEYEGEIEERTSEVRTDGPDDATSAEAEATGDDSILAPHVPVPAPAPVPAAARTSLSSSLLAPPPIFERAGSAPPFRSPRKSAAERAATYVSPMRASSSRPGLSRALSVPLEATGARTPTRSPFLGRAAGRFSTSPAPRGVYARSSPFRSPRRVPLDSPRAGSTHLPPSMLGLAQKSPGQARRSVSPVKGAPPPPPPLTVSKESAQQVSAGSEQADQRVNDPESVVGITPRSRSRSRSRSLSPVKPVQTQAPTTPGRAVFQPRALAPPQSAGRSPGGSLSLRALLMTGGGKDESGAPTATDKRVSELKSGAEGEELNLTGSSFDASFSHDTETPALPASLDAFFGLTGTSFVNDVVALVDVEKSAANRRKSMAAPSAAADAPTPAGPPTFADLTVAGACKSLLHKLYTEESRRLAESLDEVQQIYRQQEEAIRQGFVPRVFQDWSSASDETKNVMKTQFGQIKLHYLLQTQLEWKTVRSHNYGEIIGVMEQNLRGLQEDRAILAESQVAQVIPELEARHAALRAELEAERQLDAQLSAMAPEDVEYLQGLLADSEEQEEQLNGNAAKGIAGQRPELDRVKQHLISYQETYEKYSTEERRLADEIAALEELRRDKRSQADLVRLRADFDALQHLQGWTLLHFGATELVLQCAEDFVVRLRLQRGSLAAVEATFGLALAKKRAGSLGGQVTAVLLSFVRDDVVQRLAEGPLDARALVRYIGARATLLRHIRQEIALASLRYPTTLELSPPSGAPAVHIDVFCASSRRGFVVTVPLSAEMLEPYEPERWASESASARVEGRFGPGGVNALALAQTVNDRLSAGYGRSALLDAVIAAEEEGDQL